MSGWLPKTFARRPLPRHRMEPIKFVLPTRGLTVLKQDGSTVHYALDDAPRAWRNFAWGILRNQGITVENSDVEVTYREEDGDILVDLWIRERPSLLYPRAITINLAKVGAYD